jgi:glycosyltransferase involved in cell wall biosynthesis
MNKPIISFIIPIYNGDKYLNKCLDSIIYQNYGKFSFEIICVDDGSVDNSKELIKEYQNNDLNIILIENEQNLKISTTCNKGFDMASGDYIWFVGQDDWIHENSIQKLIGVILLNNPDLITFNYRRVDFNENELHSAEVFDNSDLINGAEYIRKKFGDAFPHYLLGYEWRAIFKRDYLKKQNIRFPDGGIYEDTTFLFKAILYSQRFISITDYLYQYRVHPNSISDINKKYKGSLVFEFAFIVGNEVLDLASELKETYPDFSVQLFKMAKWYFNGFAPKLIGASFKEKMVFYNKSRSNKAFVISAHKYLNPFSKILTIKLLGVVVATLLKPAYLLKKKVLDKNKKKQEWCY